MTTIRNDSCYLEKYITYISERGIGSMTDYERKKGLRVNEARRIWEKLLSAGFPKLTRVSENATAFHSHLQDTDWFTIRICEENEKMVEMYVTRNPSFARAQGRVTERVTKKRVVLSPSVELIRSEQVRASREIDHY
jgi:hypothetical protein